MYLLSIALMHYGTWLNLTDDKIYHFSSVCLSHWFNRELVHLDKWIDCRVF